MEQINHIAKKKKEYTTKLNNTKNVVEEINNNLKYINIYNILNILYI